ncbi:MAG: metal-dependent hydrolase [Bacteroidetes bacterium GWE2_41_25]|nr:MAG: metal-dependent hydrolase [Bacteroidetes bacterium GWA2_40_15]OFX96742.1 MAG: metal-dependent hydrolase [Bacteroidetes bacterium GWC2_40_22]OFY12261.1 MAG: metal-dependent hydrolase [Bacteroidetes bacterium GWE2_41_25]OFY60665.1 MAG: metal-dependent hydrolase [Bacteroidetes bacterium GWF2_41_9]HAM09132.1 metal-dependent hydrolase [Bacteroidales bacterium]
MRISLTTRLLVPLFSLIICIMATKASSQDTPEYDRISTSAGDVVMHFIGHGSLMFRLDTFAIFIDPVSSSGNYKNYPKADLILVTHEHSDHLDIKLIGELKKEGTLVFTNQKSTEQIGWAMAMMPGDRQEVNGIVIEAIPAYNIVNMRSPGQPFHPKGTGLGYILTIGGKRFYIAGDTENTPEMKALTNIEVAFLPMNLPYTMTPEMVADAAKAFKPGILYPYHYGETDTDLIVNLLKGSGTEVRIRNLK